MLIIMLCLVCMTNHDSLLHVGDQELAVQAMQISEEITTSLFTAKPYS